MADDFDELHREAKELGRATLSEYIAGTPDVYGSAAFFASATETLLQSTMKKRELGGACYFVQQRGAIVLKEERLSRVNRWLYHGLHSLDFPFLYGRRPLWDIVIVVLCLGGLVLSATTLLPAWRRLLRHARRWKSGPVS